MCRHMPPLRISQHTAAHALQVESCALLGNSRDNGFVGVNLYCDDEASFIDAPLNMRASDIAGCCGRPMQVRFCAARSLFKPCPALACLAPGACLLLDCGSLGVARGQLLCGFW